jgi:outer membrane protein OmpA-like peptidoglycan-associated protein
MRSNPIREPARPILPLLVVSGVLAIGAAARTARADGCEPPNGLSSCIDADNLWPRPGGGPLFAIGGAATAPEGKASFGLVMSYLSRPIGLRVASPDPDGTVIYALDNMLDATFLWSLGITDRLEISLAAPVTLYQDGAGLADVLGTDTELPRSVLRDPRLGVSFAILPRPRVGSPDGLALTARFDLGVPTGDEESFAGAATATAAPSAVAEVRWDRLGVALEAGARLRGTSTLAGSEVGSQLYGALGATFDILDDRWLTAGAEAFALYTLGDQRPPSRSDQEPPPLVPAEWIVSASTAPLLAGDVVLSLGGGGPIPFSSQAALTSPRFRFDLGLRYAPTGRDADGDGVLDRDDRCPAVPEDRDGFKDDDGCPDPDNDGDRIPDDRDRCRDAPETVDGFQDDDGCPDLDDDRDGVPDDEDACRNEPEDRDKFEDGDGCPEPDNDGDGILDARDTCPNGAEDVDGWKDDDGCPDPDNDLDQLPDGADRCPTQPEDRDGFQDDDGCPDPDNDEDGILDGKDACPTTPETIDGKGDEDGCPEPGARSLARWSGSQVVADNPARFTPGSAQLPPALEAQVRMMAQVIRGKAPVEAVIVEAYPDRAGDGSSRAIELAAARATAVKDVLAASGIPADRITAAAGDTSARRAAAAPQIEITVTRARGPAPAPAPAPTAAPSPPSQPAGDKR